MSDSQGDSQGHPYPDSEHCGVVDWFQTGLPDALLKQHETLDDARDRIEEMTEIQLRQGSRLVRLALDNAHLVENADEALGGRYGRLMGAVCAVEHFVWRCGRRGFRARHDIVEPLLEDTIEYGDGGPLSCLLAWAMRDAARDAEDVR